MASSLELRNIVVKGHRTSVRLEPEMWSSLELILKRERITLARLCTLIDRQRRQSSLTAAIRVYISNYFRTAAELEHDSRGRDEPSRLLAEEWQPYVQETARTTRGDDYEDKTVWSQDVLHANRHTGFFKLYDRWQAFCAARGTVPSLEDLASDALEREWDGGTINLIDVTDENPANFRLSRTTPMAASFFRSDVTNAPISLLPFQLHARSMETEFNQLKRQARPGLFGIDQSYAGTRRSYLRLALPVADEPGKITRLVSVIRGKDTEPSIYEERIFGRHPPSLQQIAENAPPWLS